MIKQQIIQALEKQYRAFADEIEVMNEAEFLKAPKGKWNAGQHTDHLSRSILPLVLGLKLPNYLPRFIFGKANRPSKNYEDLVAKYKTRLSLGSKAIFPFIPSNFKYRSKQSLLEKLKSNVEKLCKILEAYSEPQLDEIVFPHPVLEKITLREMLYFTIYHAEHHQKLVLKNLED